MMSSFSQVHRYVYGGVRSIHEEGCQMDLQTAKSANHEQCLEEVNSSSVRAQIKDVHDSVARLQKELNEHATKLQSLRDDVTELRDDSIKLQRYHMRVARFMEQETSEGE